MKRIVLLVLIGLSTNLVFAQDTIVKQNGDKILAKINEITSDSIQYKEFEFLDGPAINIKISEVSMIIYENGERENLLVTENQYSEEDSKTKNLKKFYKGKYFMLGAGIGNSYGVVGGYGLKIQMRFGGIQGFGIHAGVGHQGDDDPLTYSAGVKFFPYKGLYLNAQFGTEWINDTEVISHWEWHPGIWPNPGYHTYEIDEVIDKSFMAYGPAFLVGGDWVWGRKVAVGLNFGFGVRYMINYKEPDHWTAALDLGLIVRI